MDQRIVFKSTIIGVIGSVKIVEKNRFQFQVKHKEGLKNPRFFPLGISFNISLLTRVYDGTRYQIGRQSLENSCGNFKSEGFLFYWSMLGMETSLALPAQFPHPLSSCRRRGGESTPSPSQPCQLSETGSTVYSAGCATVNTKAKPYLVKRYIYTFIYLLLLFQNNYMNISMCLYAHTSFCVILLFIGESLNSWLKDGGLVGCYCCIVNTGLQCTQRTSSQIAQDLFSY